MKEGTLCTQRNDLSSLFTVLITLLQCTPSWIPPFKVRQKLQQWFTPIFKNIVLQVTSWKAAFASFQEPFDSRDHYNSSRCLSTKSSSPKHVPLPTYQRCSRKSIPDFPTSSTCNPIVGLTSINVTRTMAQSTLQKPTSSCRCRCSTTNWIQPIRSPSSTFYQMSKWLATITGVGRTHDVAIPLLYSRNLAP